MNMHTVKTVEFQNLGWMSAGHLYLPPDFDPARQYAAIVSTHPIGSCKEQTSGSVYGAALARAGMIVLAFDASFQGESGGAPRWLEDPALRVSDIRFAVDYLQSLSYVDAQRIGAIGICGGGGYTIQAAMTDHRIRALASITGVNFGRLMREGFSQFQPLAALQAIAQQRSAEAAGADRLEQDLLPASPQAAQQAGIQDIDVLQATEYYKTPRGQAANGQTRNLMSFNGAAVAWDAFQFAEQFLTQPLLVVAGDQPGGFGAYRDAHEIYGRAASRDKQLLIVPDCSHYDLYDQPEAVAQVLEQMLPFFRRHLAAESAR